MIDKQMHEQTKYRIPHLREQFEEAKDTVATYIWLDDNWDGYSAFEIEIETIKFTAEVLEKIYDWFEKNIGFLNNRLFKIEIMPNNDGSIHIEITYDCYNFHAFINEKVELLFRPKHRYGLNGKHTIADREVNLIDSKDMLNKKNQELGEIAEFLDEAFYKHKWKF